jgi:glycosyltransferase involved in cell wall biosynthesis
MSLKLLHVLQSVDPKHGGPIEGVKQQAKEHAIFGHSTEIACLDRPNSTFLSHTGTKVHALGHKSYDSYLPIGLYKWLTINHYYYDAIIINGIWGFHLFACWLALHDKNIPYFVFSHGMLDPWFNQTFPLKRIKKWLVWPWAIYPGLRDADAVFFTCEQEKILARKSFWLYDCREVVINYGTAGIPNPKADYSNSFFQDHPQLLNKQIFLFLGRVHPKKGPDLLLYALDLLQKEGSWNPNNMTLVLAGPNNSHYAKHLAQLAERLGISESLYWTGMITGDQKWGAFQSAKAFVLPSHQENFGISVVEALSCSTPVLISSSVNIAPEIKMDGAGLIDQDTVDGTAQLFRHWLSLDASERAEMGRQARLTFEKRFHISGTSRSITANIYLSLLERSILANLYRPK